MADLIKRDSALKGYDTVLSILDNAINAVSECKAIVLQYGSEPEQRWIPCSDRLPEENGEYLCTLVGAHNIGCPSECGYITPETKGITSGWSTCEADGFTFLRDDEVVAWMPMPEPWEGEEQ